MSDPKGTIDPRSTFAVREMAMQMAVAAQSLSRGNLVELAIEIEGYLLGDNSRILNTEQPQTPDTQSSDGESTGTMVGSQGADAMAHAMIGGAAAAKAQADSKGESDVFGEISDEERASRIALMKAMRQSTDGAAHSEQEDEGMLADAQTQTETESADEEQSAESEAGSDWNDPSKEQGQYLDAFDKMNASLANSNGAAETTE